MKIQPVKIFKRCLSYNNDTVVIIKKPEPIKEPDTNKHKLDKFV